MDKQTNHADRHPVVVLLLVNLDESISKLSTSLGTTVTVEHVLHRLLQQFTCKAASHTMLDHPTGSKHQTKDEVIKSIMRFRKESDRWTACASVLLKSTAFHRSIQEFSTGNQIDDEGVLNLFTDHTLSCKKIDLLPIVSLPRTKYNRPYIPYLTEQNDTTNRDEADGENENPFAKLNISHQYPHIALVQSSSSRIKIGLDLVVFSFGRNEFTSTANDFIQAFESSFTPYEWERIQYCCTFGPIQSRRKRDDESKLKEFFLRWSMKEAYTKALGLGMHIEFSSFETRLVGIDENNISNVSVWSTVINAINGKQLNSNVENELRDRSYSVLGKVQSKLTSTKSSGNDEWEFIFIPITTTDGARSSHDACCCICRGPLLQNGIELPNEFESKVNTQVQIEKIDLIDLIKLHM